MAVGIQDPENQGDPVKIYLAGAPGGGSKNAAKCKVERKLMDEFNFRRLYSFHDIVKFNGSVEFHAKGKK